MVDFLKKTGMIIFIIKPIFKYDKNTILLFQIMKMNSIIIKIELNLYF